MANLLLHSSRLVHLIYVPPRKSCYLEDLGVGYVLALKPSHAWWHKVGEIGSPWEAVLAASEAWNGTRDPGD